MIGFTVRKQLFTYDPKTGELFSGDFCFLILNFDEHDKHPTLIQRFSYIGDIPFSSILIGLFNQYGIGSRIVKKTLKYGIRFQHYRFSIILKSPEDKAKFLLYFGNFVL